ncbi:hypothetical protein [Micromonospora chalcea]|uniref:hypothetical protein n=1 Tax=Micromonospora chalcea TaxID=1874 RepID=UPI003D725730
MSATDETLRTQLTAVVRELQRVQAKVAEVGRAANAANETAGAAKQAAEAAQLATTKLAEELVAVVRDAELRDEDEQAAEAEKVVPGLSWLTVADPDDAHRLMRGFSDWLANVYCRWQEKPLPDCWAWHPAAVAELLALRDAWNEATNPANFSAGKAMDWIDRYRPGVARRIAKELDGCSLAKHTPDQPTAYRPPRVEGAELLGQLVEWWWQTGGRETAPGPTTEMLAASKARSTEDDEL